MKFNWFLFNFLNGVVYVLSLDDRIIGGVDAPAIPYQVSIRKYVIYHVCSGAIIHSFWILTAAHCINLANVADISIVVGTNKLDSGGDVYYPERFIVHPHYRFADPRFNDIALIKLKQEIRFGPNVFKAELPTQNTVRGTTVILTGWGVKNSTKLSNELQFILLKTIGNNECQMWLNYWRNIWMHYTIIPSQICTFNGIGKGSCMGDSGGPLVDGFYGRILVGIVSYGIPCAIGKPDVYTRVYTFRNWILSYIRQN